MTEVAAVEPFPGWKPVDEHGAVDTEEHAEHRLYVRLSYARLSSGRHRQIPILFARDPTAAEAGTRFSVGLEELGIVVL